MNLFNSRKNQEIEQLLKTSRQDFRFDNESIKSRVMLAVASRHLNKEDAKRLNFRPSVWPRYAFSVTLALILMVGTSGLAFASSKSHPGDLLFPVQKLSDKAVLILPLPQTKKAEISTNIAAKRLQELEDQIGKNNQDKDSISTGLLEAEESLNQAVEFIPKNKEEASKLDKKELEKVLQELDELSAKHEQNLSRLKSQVKDQKLLEQIKKSSERLNETKKRFQRDQFLNRKPETPSTQAKDKPQGSSAGASIKLHIED